MATIEILPFGEGQLPSGIGVVNDLTTGGATNALSAEQGKVLKNYSARIWEEKESLNIDTGVDAPVVNIGTPSSTSVVCTAGSTATVQFTVSGENLTENIKLAAMGSPRWSLSSTSLSPTSGSVASTTITLTYSPPSGTAAFTKHSCTVVVSSGDNKFNGFTVEGLTVTGPTIVLSPTSSSLQTTSNASVTETINVKGYALSADVSLAISGSGFSLSASTVSKTDAEGASGKDVTVTFDGSAEGSATVTASSTSATDVTATITGAVFTPLATGCYWDEPIAGGGALRYTVIDTGKVSVKGVSYGGYYPTSTLDSPLVIPATVDDVDKTVYDSEGTATTSSGMTYKVTTIASEGFANAKGTNLKSIIVSEGVTTIGTKAFQMSSNYATTENIIKISFPSTISSMGSGNEYTFQNNSRLREIEFKSNVTIPSYAFTGCTRLALVKLNGNTVSNNAFSGCTQFSGGSSSIKPVVVNYKSSSYTYRSWSGAKPFPENSLGEVTATFYCPDVNGYKSKGWTVFQTIDDISNYED